MQKEIDGVLMNIPEHVAIIMDGNGRWAKKRGLPRNLGHAQGAKALESMLDAAKEVGIKYVTVYAFSTENWKRSVEEVTGIMNLIRKYLRDAKPRALRNGMRVRVIGDRTRLDKDIVDLIEDLEHATKEMDEIHFTIALNYGSRDEMRRGIQKMVADAKEGVIASEDITEEMITGYLDTKDMPDPDLMIRTSGETRLSNYMLWQLAYAEFYFTDVLWPDFNKEELLNAVCYFNGRDRRFGGV